MNRISLAALASGALFGLGLAVSGMTDPRRVLAFLDVSGNFDPALVYVLGGAVLTTGMLFPLVLGRARPVFASGFLVSSLRRVDVPLLSGAGLFGIGWGIAGYCPGPALATLGVGSPEVFWFLPAMLAGMLLHRVLARR